MFMVNRFFLSVAAGKKLIALGLMAQPEIQKAMMENTELSAEEIARKALLIASSICVFTNDHITVEVV